MKNFFGKSVLLMCLSLAFVACGDDDKKDASEPKPDPVVVTLDQPELNLKVGETVTLVATVTPPQADVVIVWSSSDETVAAIEGGVVTAIGVGDAVIKAAVGESFAECSVSVIYIAPKIGDYYYSDGTWSDGGLVSIEADGLNPVWADVKPAPVAGKTVIGIVCQTDENRIAAGDKENGYTHGYVMAVKNAHGPDKDTTWWSTDWEFTCLSGKKLASSWYANVDGYVETSTVNDIYGTKMELMPAFDWTLNDFSLSAPASSSGWFLPSTGQVWDMMANFCGNDVAVYMKEWQTIGRDATRYCSETVGYDAMGRFNSVMSEIPDADKDVLVVNDERHPFCSVWTSTPYDGESTNIFNVGTDGLIECMCEWYDGDCYARPILAF